MVQKTHIEQQSFSFSLLLFQVATLLQNQALGFLHREPQRILLHFSSPQSSVFPISSNTIQNDIDTHTESIASTIQAMRRQARQAHPEGEYDNSKQRRSYLNNQWEDDNSGANFTTTTFDLVDQMSYLYVSVLKARNLPPSNPYVEVKLGNYRGTTKHFDRRANPEWNQVFAFSKSSIQSSTLEVFLKDKEIVGRDEFIGAVVFDLNEVPVRVPPDSPLASQWYRLVDRRGGGKLKGDLMLAVWMGTQADEAFSDAWHSDSASMVNSEGAVNLRSKVYVSPKLWYLRVNIIEAQDIPSSTRDRCPELLVKAQIGSQTHITVPVSTPSNANPLWNEDFVFVVAEPFEEQLVLTVEDRVSPTKDQVLGKLGLPLSIFEKRLDHRPLVHSRWFDFEKLGFSVLEDQVRRESRFASRIHLRVCLEGAYHVMDEPIVYISDTQPAARQLWKPPIGVLELGILSADKLVPMKVRDGTDTRGTTDAYCVAKYRQKWVRTRTIIGSFNPHWNEQYTWEVVDPCTVITVAVFDNCNVSGSPGRRDSIIGKLRIRISTLESNRVYTKAYPLIALQPSTNTRIRKMGEIRLSVRFTYTSLANVMHLYGEPLLPKIHYVHPFTVSQISSLRHQAMSILATRLGRAEPPLRKEVIEYVMDVDSQMWCMRRSKANFFRVMGVLSGAIWACGWLAQVCRWTNPVTTVLVHVLFLILVRCPELILPMFFLYLVVIGLWKYRGRARGPAEVDVRLSWAEASSPDEIDEEFDTFPTTRSYDLVRMRYDRLRTVAGRVQTVVGDVATQAERIHGLLSWRDPRATALFSGFSLLGAVVLYTVPFQVVVMVAGLYEMRHPRFRSRMPSLPGNFFRRLTSKVDSML